MKTLRSLFILCVIMLLAACNQTAENKEEQQAAEEGGWKTHQQDNCQIKYPAGWELISPGKMGSSFNILSPVSSDTDQFRENVSFVMQDLSGQEMDLEEYVILSEEQVKSVLGNGEIVESKRMSANNKEMQYEHYTGSQGNFNLEFIQYYWVENSIAYVLTFTAEQKEFDNFKETGMEIMDSFTFE